MNEVVPLSEVATVIAGQSPPGNTYNESGSGLPFFQGKADFGELYPVAQKWCVAPKKIAEPGDILISVRAPVGPTNIAKERCCIGRGLAAVRPNEAVVLRDFVHWVIKHRQPELVSKGQGSTFAAIRQKDLKSLPIPLLPLDEQRRIVGILNRAAKIERLRKRAQKRLLEFIPALFVKMFGDPAANSRNKNTARLSDVCTIVGGGTPHRANSNYFGGSISWAKPTDVTALSDLLYIGITAESITKAGLRKSSARLLPSGAVLLTSRATIGHTAVAAVPMATNQGFANFLCGEHLLPHYLAYWLRLRRTHLIQLAGGTTFKEISKRSLGTIEIPLPPIKKQREFAFVVNNVLSLAARKSQYLDRQEDNDITASLLSRYVRQ